MLEKGIKGFSIRKQCEYLGLSRSSYYYEPKIESAENLAVMLWLDKQYFKTPYYGIRKLLIELRSQGYKLNKKRLERLMEIQGWKTLYPKPRTSIKDREHKIYPYLLKGITIERKNQVWEIDITYLPLSKGYLYLCAIIDVYSRYVVHWDISNNMTSDWCLCVVQEAISMCGCPEIMNSDQGSQFTSNLFVDYLENRGIKISMDGKGRALDNIYIERLWRSIKYEYYYLMVFENGQDVYEGVKGYFLTYNGERRHQSLDYETPLSRYLPSA